MQEQLEGVKYLLKIVDGTYTSPLLLVGQEGVGKRFSVTQAIKQSASRGGSDESAIYQIDNKAHPDVYVIESEGGKDIGIDAVRGILAKAVTYPVVAPCKYLVVDGADRLTTAAANAILKTLEEPPDKTRFFLIAETASSVIPTIRSRCGRVNYKRLSEKFILSSIQDFVPDLTKALVYARLADGSLGRAVEYFGSSRLALRDRAFGLIRAGLNGDLATLFSAVENIGKDDLPLGIRFFEHLLYDLAMLPYAPDKITNLDIAEDLTRVRSVLGEARLGQLRSGLYALISHYNRSNLTLEFHFKAYLATSFIG